MREIILPRLDPEMKEGTILEWIRKEGDAVKKGEPIAEVEGEKVIFEVEAPESGILARILVSEGKSVPIATPIAILAEKEEEVAKAMEIQVRAPVKEEKTLRASPAARKIAIEHGVDLAKIDGSGPGGRIVKLDVLKFVEEMVKEKVSPLEVERVIPLRGIRKTIAERMASSYRTIPHVAITMEVNMSEAVKLREKMEGMMNSKIPFTAILTEVLANALGKHPILNATLDEDQIKIFKDINVGIAVAVEDGLIVPVVHKADEKNITEITSIVKSLIQKAKERRLSVEELKGGTFTITNLGGFGVDVFTPIINPPQAAILGIGRIAEKPRFLNGKIEVLPVMTLTLNFDHRIIDGAKAAEFLQEIKNLLEWPYDLFMIPS
jgi:pyruvate dehydrogenase E2 component (dihydrolipoamide acetyltransferase)